MKPIHQINEENEVFDFNNIIMKTTIEWTFHQNIE